MPRKLGIRTGVKLKDPAVLQGLQLREAGAELAPRQLHHRVDGGLAVQPRIVGRGVLQVCGQADRGGHGGNQHGTRSCTASVERCRMLQQQQQQHHHHQHSISGILAWPRRTKVQVAGRALNNYFVVVAVLRQHVGIAPPELGAAGHQEAALALLTKLHCRAAAPAAAAVWRTRAGAREGRGPSRQVLKGTYLRRRPGLAGWPRAPGRAAAWEKPARGSAAAALPQRRPSHPHRRRPRLPRMLLGAARLSGTAARGPPPPASDW